MSLRSTSVAAILHSHAESHFAQFCCVAAFRIGQQMLCSTSCVIVSGIFPSIHLSLVSLMVCVDIKHHVYLLFLFMHKVPAVQ